MRTVTATERLSVGANRFSAFAKLEIQDADLAYRDYSSLLQKDFFNGVTLSTTIDDNAMRLSGTLLRETGSLSLSPFRSDSLINRNGAGSYATTLDLWRKWKVSTAVMPEGYAPSGSDWKELVQGRVDVIDVGGQEITITGRSEDAVLLDKWIDTERQYGSVGGIAMETVIQSMLDDNLGSGVVTLYTPVSPGFLMNVWTQPKGNLMPALADVAAKAGFVIRYRYDSSNAFRLTLFKPNRTASVADWSLGPGEYLSINKCSIDKTGVRNFVKLRFVDTTLGTQTVMSPSVAASGTIACAAGVGTFSVSQASVITNGSNIIVAGVPYTVSGFNGTTGCTLSSQLASGGVPTFSASSFSASGTSTSLTQFGRVDLEIDLAYTSQVNNATAAQGMCDAVRQDTEFPNLEQEVDTLGFWFAQLYDYGQFLANGVQYDQDQFGGVTSITHTIASGGIKTTLGVRGKPAGRYTTWRELARRTVPTTKIAPPVQVQPPTAFVTPTASTVTLETVNLTGTVGTGGASPLSWQRRTTIQGSAPGSWTAWVVATGGNALPFSVAVTRNAKWATIVEFQTRDANLVLSPIAAYTVDARIAFLDDTTAAPKRAVLWDDTGTAARTTDAAGEVLHSAVADSRTFALNTHFNTAHHTTEDLIPIPGSTTRIPLATEATGGGRGFTAIDSGGIIVAGAIDFSRGYTGKHQDNIPENPVSPVYHRVTVNAVDGSGNIDLSGSGFVNKTLDHVSDTGSRFAAVQANADHTASNTAAAIAGQGALATASLVTPALSTSRNRCKLYNVASNQSVASATPTALTFNTEKYDVGSLHSTSSQTTRLTVPTGGDTGVWLLTGQIEFPGNATGVREILIEKNGTTMIAHALVASAGAAGTDTVLNISVFDDAPTVGDYYELFASHTAGVALSIVDGVGATFFSATHLW